MKAMLLRGPNMPFEPVQLPDPTPGPGEAVARVITCGSGLTIQHVKAGRRKANFPRVLGHEIAAEIVAVGAGVTSLKIGDGVTAYYYLELRPLPALPRQPRAAVHRRRRQCRHRVRRRLCGVRQAAGARLRQIPRNIRLACAAGRSRRDHRCAGDALQGAEPRRHPRRRDRRGDRRRWRRRHPPGDDGELGERACDRRRGRGGEVRRLPQGRRRHRGRCAPQRCRCGAARSHARRRSGTS